MQGKGSLTIAFVSFTALYRAPMAISAGVNRSDSVIL